MHTTKAIFGDLGLLAFVPIVEGNNSSGTSIWCVELDGCAALDCEILLVVPAVDLKGLVVIGFVVDGNCMHFGSKC